LRVFLLCFSNPLPKLFWRMGLSCIDDCAHYLTKRN